ncbi:hypothetical protein PIB30_028643 [Stylosanthes scabra]|uniref:Autophagy-related protein n=1 Tax=Stylosanthes scabra TaxID=79078 RepID=A0ABU6Z7V9_9FABA|nr:hypothetical protein [Stylosanthes scabra]
MEFRLNSRFSYLWESLPHSHRAFKNLFFMLEAAFVELLLDADNDETCDENEFQRKEGSAKGYKLGLCNRKPKVHKEVDEEPKAMVVLKNKKGSVIRNPNRKRNTIIVIVLFCISIEFIDRFTNLVSLLNYPSLPLFGVDRTSSFTMAKSSFKLEHPLERRQAEASRIREKYPDRIPVIVEKAERSDIPDIDKKKYLVPADLTVGQFVYVVRKRIKLSAEKAIFVFINNTLPPTAALMSAIYEENKDDDGFLYMTYSGENTFGFR